MRSVTSCFNSTLYRKTMARFWPMWVLYSVMWLFLFPLNLLNGYFDTLRYSEDILVAQENLLKYAKDMPAMLEGACGSPALPGSWRPWRCSAISTTTAPPV